MRWRGAQGHVDDVERSIGNRAGVYAGVIVVGFAAGGVGHRQRAGLVEHRQRTAKHRQRGRLGRFGPVRLKLSSPVGEPEPDAHTLLTLVADLEIAPTNEPYRKKQAMKLRTTIAGLAITGVLTAGFIGVADAQTNSTSSGAPTTHEFNCDTAKDHLARLRTRIEALKDHIAKAEARVDQLRKDGHNDRADALAKRVDRAKDRLSRLEARLDRVQKRIEDRCGADPNTAPSSST